MLAPALRMFPDDQAIAFLNGWLATRRREVAEAERIWREARERYPNEVDGYLGYALALRDVGRLDEADSILAEASVKFPSNVVIAMDFARIPERKRNWPQAVERWRQIVGKFPDVTEAYIGLANSLRDGAFVAEAQAVLRIAIERFPDSADVAAAAAGLASSLRDWPSALLLWAGLQQRHPHNPSGYLGLGRALRDCGDFQRSADTFVEALSRFPHHLELEVELALSLSWKREWPRAMALWESLKQRHPDVSHVRWGISQILDRALRDQTATDIGFFEIPPSVLHNKIDESEHISRLAALLVQFESLGDTCEFGMVQRMFHADPISLLRWASTAPEDLVTALDTNFDGVGDPENTIIRIENDEYITEDRRYYMLSHTFTPPATEPIELFSVEQCRRMQWLRRKLISDLSAAKKIFVYKSNTGLTDEQMLALHASLRRYNPKLVLLCVRLQNPEYPTGTVVRIQDGLFVGYIDRFSTVDISVNAWVNLCEHTAARLSAGPPQDQAA